MDESTDTVRDILKKQLDDLYSLQEHMEHEDNTDFVIASLDLWRKRTKALIYQHVSPDDAEMFSPSKRRLPDNSNLVVQFNNHFMHYRNRLVALMDDLANNGLPPTKPTSTSTSNDHVATPHPATKDVFLIHGHDEENLNRLARVLRERWNLNPIILSDQASRGRTLIEKFEQVAAQAAYAIALLTPDDIVSFEDQGKDYAQARPNVIFELGWFYGKLKRERVCILSQKGTQIHSDLAGINRIDFRDNIKEAYMELETELKDAGLL